MASPLQSNQSPSPSSGLQGPLNLLHFYPSDFISYHIFLEHPIPASPALWGLSNARLTPTSRLLHLLFMFTLPGMLFLQAFVQTLPSVTLFYNHPVKNDNFHNFPPYSTNISGLPFSLRHVSLLNFYFDCLFLHPRM